MTADHHDTRTLVPTWLVAVVVLLLALVMLVSVLIFREMRERAQAPATGEAAVARLERAVTVDPTDVPALLDLAIAHQESERFDDALEAYRLALAQDPRNVDVLYGRGVALLALGRGDEAEEPLLTVLAMHPEHVPAAHALGTHYLAMERYEELLAVVEPASYASIGVSDLCYLAGRAYEALGEEPEAEACYRNALQYVPDMSAAEDGLRRLGVTR